MSEITSHSCNLHFRSWVVFCTTNKDQIPDYGNKIGVWGVSFLEMVVVTVSSMNFCWSFSRGWFKTFVIEIIVQEIPVHICSVLFKSCHLCSLPSIFALTFRHRASCILGQAFHCYPENIFIYLIIKYISLSDICLTVHHWYK